MLVDDNAGDMQNTTVAADLNPAMWPADTDIVYPPGSNKLSLTAQRPLLHGVIQDSFENVRASLLFDHAFPDPVVAPLTIRAALIAAADNPRALSIRNRLVGDGEYLGKLTRLVSAGCIDI
jgi:hypothetical protein